MSETPNNSLNNAAAEWPWKRILVNVDENGESYVQNDKVSVVMHRPGFVFRADLWSTQECPVNNEISTDRAFDNEQRREPFPNGIIARNLMLYPDPDPITHRQLIEKLHGDVKQSHMPNEKDYSRSLNMHRTNTLDIITCVFGEIWLVTDQDEILMRPGDTTIIRGGNHSWSNRSDAPCLLSGVMVDAIPRDVFARNEA